jgi:hypothetical protein
MPETKHAPGSADYLFQRIAAGKPERMSLVGSRKIEARKWFRERALEVTQVNAAKFIARANNDRMVNYLNKSNIGQMFTFLYDAKLKKKLPYWDRFPLIFMIETYSDGFLGINLHYLPPTYRSALMDALYRNLNNNKNNETSRLIISYQILKSASKYRNFKPCVKKYLINHVGSRYIRILPEEWDMAMMLPTERFMKAKKTIVWAESVEAIKNEDE